MKNTIYIITLLISAFTLGQEVIVPLEQMPSYSITEKNSETYYFKDVNNVLDKFVGTWKYDTANESLEITFYKVLHETSSNNFIDMLDCNFIYIKNGVTIFDTNTITDPEEKYFITGAYLRGLNKIDLDYSEPTSPRDWRARLILDYIPASNGEPEKLDWFVKTFAKKTVNGVKVYPFEIPYNLQLIKQ
ncbi:DUF6705 family protein [Olleya aquimaris]|uniref:DUF6705 domain-containing protein n=1 Tax=Olleya aquimaris TaxID=639310 RepID=A0A327RIH7_9FLAO|nr:DUF6705 family protein [Olleya aquimaris]RAJ13487.1 hypothetical protein LY08_02006 [Olleya aquimaris]